LQVDLRRMPDVTVVIAIVVVPLVVALVVGLAARVEESLQPRQPQR
jgi:hypothetical protein